MSEQQPTRLELYKAGKIEERRRPRTPQAPQPQPEEVAAPAPTFRISKAMVFIAALLIAMMALAIFAL